MLEPQAQVKKIIKINYINPKGKFILSPQEQRQGTGTGKNQSTALNLVKLNIYLLSILHNRWHILMCMVQTITCWEAMC